MNDAFDLMLGVYRSPVRAALLPGRALPAQLYDVLRLAGGDADAAAAAREATGLDDAELAEAAALLLHQLLFFDGADHYRVLGVEPDVDAQDLKRHYRALMRWLHPDRDPDNLNSVFAERVNRAWSALRTAQRRADYDNRRPPPDIPAATTAVTVWQPLDRPWLSGRAVRRLPQLVAALGALTAAALLTLLFWLDRAPVAAAPRPRAAEPVAVTEPPAAAAERVLAAAYAAPALTAAATASGAEPDLAAAVAVTEPATEAMPPASTAPAHAQVPAAQARTSTAAAAPSAAPPTTPTRTPAPQRRLAAVRPAPASTAIAVPSDEASPDTAAASLSDTEILAFVARFEHLYAGDDVEQFLALFDAGVVGNGNDGLDQLRTDYRRLFSRHARRELRLEDMQWRIDGTRAVGHGRYAARVDVRGSRRDTQGQILLGLARDGDGLRIVRLNHSGSR